jgi:hypothetical protein
MKRVPIVTAMTLMLSLLAVATVGAQETEDSMAKKLANPLAAWINVPIQINYDDDLGVGGDGSVLQINVQPVIPFQLNDEWNLITRTIIPIIHIEDITRKSDDVTGVGDIVESVFFSPIQPTERGWIWGVGPVLLLPTASDDILGSDQWAVGPTFIALKQTGSWTVGLLANHLWTIAGDNDGDGYAPLADSQHGSSVESSSDISASYVEPWVSFTTPIGTILSASSETAYDWNAEQWTVPVVLTADHLFANGPIPFSIGAAARYWAESADGGPEGWAGRVQCTVLFPK